MDQEILCWCSNSSAVIPYTGTVTSKLATSTAVMDRLAVYKCFRKISHFTPIIPAARTLTTDTDDENKNKVGTYCGNNYGGTQLNQWSEKDMQGELNEWCEEKKWNQI